MSQGAGEQDGEQVSKKKDKQSKRERTWNTCFPDCRSARFKAEVKMRNSSFFRANCAARTRGSCTALVGAELFDWDGPPARKPPGPGWSSELTEARGG